MNIENEVMGILAQQAGRIGLNDKLRDDIDLDSIDEVELVMVFEKEFGIEYDADKDLGTFHTVRDVVDFVKKQSQLK